MVNTNEPSPSPHPETVAHSTEIPRTSTGQSWFAALRARLGLGPQQTLRDTLEEAVRSDLASDGTFSPTERDMLLRLLRFGALRVEDVMVPRADIIAVDEEQSISNLMQRFLEAGVSRIPIYHETLDEPRGMVHVKDLLRFLSGPARDETAATAGPNESESGPRPVSAIDQPVRVSGLLRPVLNVPRSMPAINLLIRMQSTRNHIALVVDEYGGTDGLVTIEDLVEQVVGDIEDEYDIEEAANITDDPRQGLIAQARTPIDELERHLGLKLLQPDDEGEIDTVGGLVVARLGRVPVKGELVAHESGIELEVLDADPRRIKRVRVHRPRGAVQVPPGAQPAPARSAEEATVSSSGGESGDMSKRG